ncbi:MAG: MarR family winged helix-turn-helix transcriptional regulator [Clostridiaceae bacterium]
MNKNTTHTDDISSLLIKLIPLVRNNVLRKVNHKNNIPSGYFKILFSINNNGKMTISELSKKLNITKSNISPIIKYFEQKGLISRVYDQTDRRYINIELTETGVDFVNQYMYEINLYIENILSSCEKDTSEVLLNSLLNIHKILG